MNSSNSPVNLRVAIQNLDSLPALPFIAQKLLALDTESDEGQRQLISLIGQDPQISAKVIGMANSPMLGASRKITSVSEAAIFMGINRIKSISYGIAMMSLKSDNIGVNLDMHDFWVHNLGIAFAMLTIGKAMPRSMRPADDTIFLAGMLHDIGYIALAHLDPVRSNELHTYLAAPTQRTELEIERSLVDMCHDELGAALAKNWDLPEEIIAAIRYHHTPALPGAPQDQPLIRMIYIAEKMLPDFGMNEHVSPGIQDADWEALGIEPANAEDIMIQAAEQADQAALFASGLS